MLNEGLRFTVNAGGERSVTYLGRHRRFSTAGRWVGVVLGLTTLSLGGRIWRDLTHAPRTTPAAVHGERHGAPHVADGDSVTIEGTRLRLVGLDAPELSQTCRRDERGYPCGETARDHLVGLIAGRRLDCVWQTRDKYGRGLARCRAGSVDLNAAMVRDGWAVAYGGFEAEEAEARRNRRGLWAGRFEWPEDFRRRERGAAPRTDEYDEEAQ